MAGKREKKKYWGRLINYGKEREKGGKSGEYTTKDQIFQGKEGG